VKKKLNLHQAVVYSVHTLYGQLLFGNGVYSDAVFVSVPIIEQLVCFVTNLVAGLIWLCTVANNPLTRRTKGLII